jgi:hypothetical protein
VTLQSWANILPEYSKMEPGLPDPNESIFLAFIFTIVKVGG